MPESKLVVLGSSGLLGSAVQRAASASGATFIGLSRANYPNFSHLLRNPHLLITELELNKRDFVFNAVGKTKQRINLDNRSSVVEAEWLNSTVPTEVSHVCAEHNIRYLQIGTDCVFSGNRGQYLETDHHDASDIYGKTKSKGELSEHVNLIRTSFVGPSSGPNPGLWGWVNQLDKNSEIIGYTNHLWNGVSVGLIARLVLKIYSTGTSIQGAQHLVPQDRLTKFELVRLIVGRLGRYDIQISQGNSEITKDMTLNTVNPTANAQLWEIAGYKNPPVIEELIASQQIDFSRMPKN